MQNLTLHEFACRIKGDIVINQQRYLFYNNMALSSGYRKYPIDEDVTRMDGRWSIEQDSKGIRLITKPDLFSEPVYLSFSLLPESIFDQVIEMGQFQI